MPAFTIGAGASKRARGSFAGGDIAADHRHARMLINWQSISRGRARPANGRVPCHYDHVRRRRSAARHAPRSTPHAHGGADTQCYLPSFYRARKLRGLLDVHDGDQPLRPNFRPPPGSFDAVLMQQPQNFVSDAPSLHRHEFSFSVMMRDTGSSMAGLRPQIAVRDDARQFAAMGDRHAGNMVLRASAPVPRGWCPGRGGDGIADDAAFVLFDLTGLLRPGAGASDFYG